MNELFWTAVLWVANTWVGRWIIYKLCGWRGHRKLAPRPATGTTPGEKMREQWCEICKVCWTWDGLEEEPIMYPSYMDPEGRWRTLYRASSWKEPTWN
jgi:hypothetical protein